MNKIISEKIMMKCIEVVRERLILSEGEGDMSFQEFIKWVNDGIVDCYDYENGEVIE